MKQHQTTKAEWLSAQYLSHVVQNNTAITFSDDEEHFSAGEVEPAASAKLHVLGQCLSLEKLWQVWQSLKPILPLQGFVPRISGFGQSFIVPLSNHDVPADNIIKYAIEKVTYDLGLDIVFIEQAPKLSEPGLLVMDMDSTVIQVECIDEMANRFGVGEQVSQITAQAMMGELDFAQSLVQRVGCLEGMPADVLAQVCGCLPLMPGIESLVRTLKLAGWKIAIASGGFTFFADYLKERLGLDHAVSNALEIEDECLTGKIIGTVVDAQVKAETLTNLAQQFGIKQSQTIAMGDGANDLIMMQHAGLGVGCHAKPAVRQEADCSIRFAGLDALLALLDD